MIAFDRSDNTTGGQAYQQALPLDRQVGEVQGEATCHAMLGRVAQILDAKLASVDEYRVALALFERVGARAAVAWHMRISPASQWLAAETRT